MGLDDLYCDAAKAVEEIIDHDLVPAGRRLEALQRLKEEIDRGIDALKEAGPTRKRKTKRP